MKVLQKLPWERAMEGRHPWTQFPAIAKTDFQAPARVGCKQQRELWPDTALGQQLNPQRAKIWSRAMEDLHATAECHTGSRLAAPTCSSPRGVPRFAASLLPGTSLEMAKGNTRERDFVNRTTRQVIFSQDFYWVFSGVYFRTGARVHATLVRGRYKRRCFCPLHGNREEWEGNLSPSL